MQSSSPYRCCKEASQTSAAALQAGCQDFPVQKRGFIKTTRLIAILLQVPRQGGEFLNKGARLLIHRSLPFFPDWGGGTALPPFSSLTVSPLLQADEFQLHLNLKHLYFIMIKSTSFLAEKPLLSSIPFSKALLNRKLTFVRLCPISHL